MSVICKRYRLFIALHGFPLRLHWHVSGQLVARSNDRQVNEIYLHMNSNMFIPTCDPSPRATRSNIKINVSSGGVTYSLLPLLPKKCEGLDMFRLHPELTKVKENGPRISYRILMISCKYAVTRLKERIREDLRNAHTHRQPTVDVTLLI